MKNVIVYSTNTCPYCDMTKRWLKDNNIVFVEKNVQEDYDAAEEMMAKSGQMGVPVIDIDGTIIIGFDVNKLKKMLLQ